MPGSSFEAIEEAIKTEVGGLKSKRLIDEFMAKKLREFREDKRKEARAKEIQEAAIQEAAAGAAAAAAATAAAAAETRTETTTTVTTTTVTTERRTSPRLNPIKPAASATTPPTVVPPTQPGRSGLRSSGRKLPMANATTAKAPAVAGLPPNAPNKKKRTATLTPDFRGIDAKRPKLACGETSGTTTERLVPPKYMVDDNGNAGYTDPTQDWVDQQVHKMTILKHFVNLCADRGIAGPRAELDSAVEKIMGGAATYDRNFILLLTFTIADNMKENDDALLKILESLKTANALTPASIASLGARGLSKIVAPHDKGLKTQWIVQMCNVLDKEHGGKVPSKPQEILAIGLPQITSWAATAVSQEACGWHYGPVVDHYYGIRMAFALDLIHIAEYGHDKYKINFLRDVYPNQVQASLLTWLPTREWKGFHKLMVSTVQMIVEAKDRTARMEDLQKIVRKNFMLNDKNLLLGMLENIEEIFVEQDDP